MRAQKKDSNDTVVRNGRKRWINGQPYMLQNKNKQTSDENFENGTVE